MLTQLYRPGWQAQLSDGRTVSGYDLFSGFTGFDLPPGVDSARISYQPTVRMALTGLTWFTLAFSLVTIAAISLLRPASRLRRRRDSSYAIVSRSARITR